MTTNQLRRLRKQRKLSIKALADTVDYDSGNLSRIERGERGLRVDLAKKIASALGVSLGELYGLGDQQNIGDATQGFSENVEPYNVSGDDILSSAIGRRTDLAPFRVKTNTLSQIGIHAGDIVLANISDMALRTIQPLKPVIAQLYDDEDLLKAVTIIRQFVPPNLLITNSTDANEPIINMDREDAHIKGVVVSVHRAIAG